jgi:hypothetical protein
MPTELLPLPQHSMLQELCAEEVIVQDPFVLRSLRKLQPLAVEVPEALRGAVLQDWPLKELGLNKYPKSMYRALLDGTTVLFVPRSSWQPGRTRVAFKAELDGMFCVANECHVEWLSGFDFMCFTLSFTPPLVYCSSSGGEWQGRRMLRLATHDGELRASRSR